MFRSLRAFSRRLGPGIITGASDDDPSGILTYLQAGAILGLQTLWLTLFTLPLMYGVQEMCARLGLQTGRGLMQLIKEHYPRPLMLIIGLVVSAVIAVNIGANLSAMGVVLSDMLGGNQIIWILFSAFVIVFSIVFFSYRNLARILKWLTLSLFCYVLTVFFIAIDWRAAWWATFLFKPNLTPIGIFLMTAILGTTISPYLFFWQTSEEVEERNDEIIQKGLKRFLVTQHELRLLRSDVFLGMLFSNLVAWFIILGASRLNSLYGVSEISNFSQASLVLQPLLGPVAYTAFALGIIGTGLLSIPVLAGGVGYIMAEMFNWSEGINKKFYLARGFYAAIICATLVGVAINLLRVNTVQLLIYAAVLYTLITPPLILLILRFANDKKIMATHTNGWLANTLGILALLTMTGAALAYLMSW